jgi:hypothetical protein
MSRRAAIVLALVAIAVGAALLVHHARRQRASEDFPEGTDWLCTGCGAGFNRSLDQLADWHRQHPGPPPCPACGQATSAVRAFHCRNRACGLYFTNALYGTGKPACPKCRREL